MRYWLVKSEPESYSIDDLQRDGRTFWDGVRNYQARNYLRDGMKLGDLAFFYHSGGPAPAIVGLAKVVREGYPDHTAFDPKSHHFDEKSKKESPTWMMVDLEFVRKIDPPLTLETLRGVKSLSKMVLLQKGSRLSVQPVAPEEFETIMKLADSQAGATEATTKTPTTKKKGKALK